MYLFFLYAYKIDLLGMILKNIIEFFPNDVQFNGLWMLDLVRGSSSPPRHDLRTWQAQGLKVAVTPTPPITYSDINAVSSSSCMPSHALHSLSRWQKAYQKHLFVIATPHLTITTDGKQDPDDSTLPSPAKSWEAHLAARRSPSIWIEPSKVITTYPPAFFIYYLIRMSLPCKWDNSILLLDCDP